MHAEGQGAASGTLENTVLIMAGGHGERLWPLSRVAHPKQFISLTGDNRSMIRMTVDRVLKLAPARNIFIATNAEYRSLVHQQLPELPMENILLEPVARNTAACIGLAAIEIRRRLGDAVMMVLPSDHMILQEKLFIDTLRQAAQHAACGKHLITLGISPTGPNTGYGYIHYGGQETGSQLYPVLEFVEKPDIETARAYVQSGDYLWNSGMFIWKVSSILEALERFMPDSYGHLCCIERALGTPEAEKTLKSEFPRMEAVSIDYGVMERADNIFTIPSSFGWDDVGSWNALERINPVDGSGNVFIGNVLAMDSTNCIVRGSDRAIAIDGVQDLVVVDTADVLLVCDKKQTDNIKQLIQKIRSEHREDLL